MTRQQNLSKLECWPIDCHNHIHIVISSDKKAKSDQRRQKKLRKKNQPNSKPYKLFL